MSAATAASRLCCSPSPVPAPETGSPTGSSSPPTGSSSARCLSSRRTSSPPPSASRSAPASDPQPLCALAPSSQSRVHQTSAHARRAESPRDAGLQSHQSELYHSFTLTRKGGFRSFTRSGSERWDSERRSFYSHDHDEEHHSRKKMRGSPARSPRDGDQHRSRKLGTPTGGWCTMRTQVMRRATSSEDGNVDHQLQSLLGSVWNFLKYCHCESLLLAD